MDLSLKCIYSSTDLAPACNYLNLGIQPKDLVMVTIWGAFGRASTLGEQNGKGKVKGTWGRERGYLHTVSLVGSCVTKNIFSGADVRKSKQPMVVHQGWQKKCFRPSGKCSQAFKDQEGGGLQIWGRLVNGIQEEPTLRNYFQRASSCPCHMTRSIPGLGDADVDDYHFLQVQCKSSMW